MPLDVYVGSFSRFYAREWENVAERYARESGIGKVIGLTEAPEPANWEDVSEAVERWREALNSGLGDNLDVPLDWDESHDSPYFTDRPGYEGYGALMLWAAHTEAGSTPPAELASEWYEDKIFAEYCDPAKSNTYRAIISTGLWLPGTFQFSFDFPYLTGDEVHITSNEALHDALVVLNRQTLKLEPAELEERLEEGIDEGASLREMAEFGLAMFTELCEKSVEHGLPILIDS